jgi:hypothetical protein
MTDRPPGRSGRTVDVAKSAVNDKLRAGTKGDVDRHFLKGQATPLIEEHAGAARNFHSALQWFGAEVVARDAAEAIERLDEFDFSSASLDWSPDSPEHSAIARRLKEEGVRFLFRAKEPPEGVTTSRGAPSSQNRLRPRRALNRSHSLPTRRERCCALQRGDTGARDLPGPSARAGRWGSATRGAKD